MTDFGVLSDDYDTFIKCRAKASTDALNVKLLSPSSME
jgi:hypothetical protein